MRLLHRNLRKFELMSALYKKDRHGDGKNVYGRLPARPFSGNIQPLRESADVKDYGIKREYMHFIYTNEDKGFKETDRITDGKRWYEVKAVRRRTSYLRLLVEEVFPDGRH